MRRRYRKDDSDLEDLFSALFGLTILGSLGLYFADRALFYEAVAGLVVLVILIVVGAILWAIIETANGMRSIERSRKTTARC
jgi:hypothetical protein